MHYVIVDNIVLGVESSMYAGNVKKSIHNVHNLNKGNLTKTIEQVKKMFNKVVILSMPAQ